jgi:aminopeptidase
MLPYVTASWAKQVFPELAADVAQQRLWEVVLEAAYVVESGSMQDWDAHLATLDLRREALQGLSLRALRFFDRRTDLTVELAKEHRWQTASAVGANGVRGVHTIPSEELFTSLGSLSASGRVFFSRPIALGGTMVERLFAEFDRGRLVRLGADRGAAAFEGLIGADERSRGLCEVGLVAASSPLARSGTSYWNPLLDRNAASHVTFGPEKADGESGLRIDCMIGHAGMHVDGVMPDGEVVPVMREGEFVAVASAAGGGGVFAG